MLEGGSHSATISESGALPLPSVTEQIDFGVLCVAAWAEAHDIRNPCGHVEGSMP